jgi:hypothetical protein
MLRKLWPQWLPENYGIDAKREWLYWFCRFWWSRPIKLKQELNHED